MVRDEITFDSKSTINEDSKDISETSSEKYNNEEDFLNEEKDISYFIVLDILEKIMLISEQHYIETENKPHESLNQFFNDIIQEVINTNVGSIHVETDNSLDIFEMSEDSHNFLTENIETHVQNLENIETDTMADDFQRMSENQQEGNVDEDSHKKVKFSKLYIGNKQRNFAVFV